MKLRIKKNNLINEKHVLQSTMSTKYILNNLFKADSKNSIFNKKLIFYDLETNGFGNRAYIHQIAALEFDLAPILMTALSGGEIGDLIRNLKAENGIVIKSKFALEDFYDQDEEVRELRKEAYSKYASHHAGKDKEAFKVLRSLFAKKYKDRRDGKWKMGANLELDPKSGDAEAIIGSMLSILKHERKSNSEAISNVIYWLDRDGVDLDPITKSQIEKCLNKSYKTDKKGKPTKDKRGREIPYWEIKEPSTFLKDQDDDEKRKFFIDLCDLFKTLVESPYGFTKKRGQMRNNATNELKSVIEKFSKKIFAFTYSENKNFTEYDEFPQDHYKHLQPDKKMPSEKEGIVMFLKYLKSLGKDNYILVGHNIKAFDNSVILKRSKYRGISEELTSFFQDSIALDTRYLLELYTKQMQFFNDMLPEVEEGAGMSDDTLKTMRRSSAGVDAITAMHKKLKAKLDGLMKVFEETRKFKQTHTADDDCEKLAQVMIRSVVDMYEMDRAFQELSEKIQLHDPSDKSRPDFRSFISKKIIPSEIREKALVKIKQDLEFENLLSAEDAMLITGEQNPKEAKEKLVRNFVLKLAQRMRADSGNKRDEEVLFDILMMSRLKIKKEFVSWLDFQKEKAAQKGTQPELPFQESVLRKWKRSIK